MEGPRRSSSSDGVETRKQEKHSFDLPIYLGGKLAGAIHILMSNSDVFGTLTMECFASMVSMCWKWEIVIRVVGRARDDGRGVLSLEAASGTPRRLLLLLARIQFRHVMPATSHL